jgi:hypothetical protein
MVVAAISGLFCFGPANGAEPAAPTPAAKARDDTSPQAITRLVKQLEDADADKRHAASVQLRNMPGSVLPTVEAAAAGAGPAAQAELKLVLPMLRARASSERRLKGDFDTNLNTALQAYEKVGRKNPRWDDAARAAIRAFVRPGFDPFRTPEDRQRRFETIRKPIDLGCDDPLIRYCHLLAVVDVGAATPEELKQPRKAAAQALLDSDYPADRKVWAVVHYAGEWLPASNRKPTPVSAAEVAQVDRAMERAFALFPEAVKATNGIKALELADRMMALAERRTWLVAPGKQQQKFDRKGAYERLHAAMEQGMADSAYPYIFEGQFYIRYAWDARGGGYADTVTEQGWRDFHGRLALAERALTKAFELDPVEPQSSAAMITVCMGLSKPRPEMEKWFRRATAADPDLNDPYEKKFLYLEPKWLGSVEEMLAFARECRDGENWRGGIPLKLAHVHENLADMTDDRVAYLSQDEVWREVSEVYETYLKMYPAVNGPRARFAKLAIETGHWKEAHPHLVLLGDKPPTSYFPDPAEYAKLRQRAADEAGAAAVEDVLKKKVRPADAPVPF